MPIQGLTDKQAFGAGLPRLGTLYKGDAKPEGQNKPGPDLSYFRFEPESEFAHLAGLFAELYGAQPDCFDNVFLAGSTADEVFPTWMEEWTATKLVHRCDGHTQIAHWDGQQTQRTEITCAQKNDKGCKCGEIGRLKLLFPDLMEATGILGYIACATHSIYDIMRLHRYLSDLEVLRGGLGGIPFTFGRAPKEVSVPNPKKGGRMNITKSLLYLHANPEFVRGVLLPEMAQRPMPTVAALPARVIVDGATGEIIEGNPQTTNEDEWPNEADLKYLLHRAVNGLDPDATPQKVARWAGVEDFYNLDAWRKFENRGAAAKAIKMGFDADKVFGQDDEADENVTDEAAIADSIAEEITDECRSVRYATQKVQGVAKGVVIFELNGGETVQMIGRDRLRKLGDDWKEAVQKWIAGTIGNSNRYVFADLKLPNLLITYEQSDKPYPKISSIVKVDIPF
jgi:hypothetical protein